MHDMRIILLSGGSGKRLWPLSNDVRSKQFIKIFKTEDGKHESMLERVYRQIKKTVPEASVMIATAQTQASATCNQLGDKVSLCTEPCRRDTFPAIALAAAKLYDIEKAGRDEVVIVCPVDPYVEDAYFASFSKLEEQVQQTGSNLVLLGMEPTYPSEKYGYIIPADEESVSVVSEFKEKPDAETAKKYIARGALWNGGVFAFHLSYLLDKTAELTGYHSYQELFDNYEKLMKISFDYAVVEKETKVQVVRFSGEWRDVGTWNTITEVMGEQGIGEFLTDERCENLHVINELDMPVLCMGLKNIVVSASPQGILVADKGQSSYMKSYVDGLHQEIMFAEKSWGFYRVLDVGKTGLTIKVTLNPGHKMNYHSHRYRDEVWTVISGNGYAVLDGVKQEVKVGDVIRISAFCKHTVIARTELQIIEVQSGMNITVEDKEIFDFLDT